MRNPFIHPAEFQSLLEDLSSDCLFAHKALELRGLLVWSSRAAAAKTNSTTTLVYTYA